MVAPLREQLQELSLYRSFTLQGKHPTKHLPWWRRLSPLSSEDVSIKTNIFTLVLLLQKTPSRRLQDVLVKTNIFVLAIRLQDVFKTSSRRLQHVLSRRLQDFFKTSSRRFAKTYSKRLQDVFKMSWSRPTYLSWQYVFKTLPRRLVKTSCKNVFKTSSRRLQDAFKTSSRPLGKISSRHFQDLSSN